MEVVRLEFKRSPQVKVPNKSCSTALAIFEHPLLNQSIAFNEIDIMSKGPTVLHETCPYKQSPANGRETRSCSRIQIDLVCVEPSLLPVCLDNVAVARDDAGEVPVRDSFDVASHSAKKKINVAQRSKEQLTPYPRPWRRRISGAAKTRARRRLAGGSSRKNRSWNTGTDTGM